MEDCSVVAYGCLKTKTNMWSKIVLCYKKPLFSLVVQRTYSVYNNDPAGQTCVFAPNHKTILITQKFFFGLSIGEEQFIGYKHSITD